jgi:Zn-dependent protease
VRDPAAFSAASLLGGAYEEILTAIVLWNCVLAIFNLVPIPRWTGRTSSTACCRHVSSIHGARTSSTVPFLLLGICCWHRGSSVPWSSGRRWLSARFLVG